ASLLLSEIRIGSIPEAAHHHGTAAKTCSDLGVAEAITDAAHRKKVLRIFGIVLDLFAQMADVDVDRARVTVGRIAPDPCEQHVAREHATWGSCERREDLELDVGQLSLVAADAD